MWDLLFAQAAIESAQLVCFDAGQRTAIGLGGEVDDSIDLSRLVCDQLFAERGGAFVDRRA